MGAPKLLFIAMLATAALVPALVGIAPNEAEAIAPDDEVAWPASFDGRALTQLPLSAVEQRFAAQFPGRIGRFTDGTRDIIIRMAHKPTRLLHPASDCFRGLGYRVDTPRVVAGSDGMGWSCFVAQKDAQVRRVCERIYDTQGNAWTDASGWYWAALFGHTRGPWFAQTVATIE